MFRKTAYAIIAAAVFGTGSFTAAPAAQARSLQYELQIGNNGVQFREVERRDRGKRGHRAERRHGRHDRFDRRHRGGRFERHGPRHRRGCAPRLAMRKAHRLGVNRPSIRRISHRAIVVTGWNYGHRARVVFSKRSPRCHVIRARGVRR